jgi:3-dehydroquinate dehydratase/shikimate dehydrogenase
VQSVAQALAAAAAAAERGADLIEFRIDRFGSGEGTRLAADLAALVEGSPLPCIVTCRSAAEGGLAEVGDEARIERLVQACSGSQTPAYVDAELATYQRRAEIRHALIQVVDHPGQASKTTTGLILSTHDFAGRPNDLYQRIEAMAAEPACRIMKIVWQARSVRDNLEAFELLLQRQKPMVVLCMGETGLPSRVLARKFGAAFTFASVETGRETAPGQPTLGQMKRLYRWDDIGARTKVYAVVGYPVAHSMSPAVHNAGFAHIGHDGVYLPLPIPPEYEHFKASIGAWLDMKALDFRGASVTIPHKENLLRFVTERGGEVEALAKQIGAANTLTVRDDGSLYASNSDYAAALETVRMVLAAERRGMGNLSVGVIGAGGAARAVVAGFCHNGALVTIYNRTLAKAQALAECFARAPGRVGAAPLEALRWSPCRVLINCTPVGMHPNVDATPMPDEATWGAGQVVFDTIYNPIQTRFLREAKAAGCFTISGVEMFVRQAAVQFTLWTGAPAPLDVFRKVLGDQLHSRQR